MTMIITRLIIPIEFAKELDIENCKVSITVLRDFHGRKHLLMSKYNREIVLDWFILQKPVISGLYQLSKTGSGYPETPKLLDIV